MNAFLRLQGCRLGSSLDHLVILPGVQHSSLRIVVPLQVEYVLQLLLHCPISHRAQYLNPVVDIPGHQVRRAQQILGLTPIVENINTGVLEIPVNNADRFNVVRYSLDAR